jgi:pyruvate kinase
MRAGMRVARINCSHTTPKELQQRIRLIRKVAKSSGHRIEIMADLQGPRLRVTNVGPKGRMLRDGETVQFDTRPVKSATILHIDDPYLHEDIQSGHPIYLANGLISVQVKKVRGTRITGQVLHGGHLFNRKAVNVPHTTLTTSGLTDKDLIDVAVAVGNAVDYIALSFVQTDRDIPKLRELVGNDTKIVAKIEMAVALHHLSAIIRASDAVMVARGDLGSEIPVEDVPWVQKDILKKAKTYTRPGIVATQMLISMVDQPHPTRAEVSDVANAVADGATFVMLSDETAAGKYPVAAVRTMAKIVQRALREK